MRRLQGGMLSYLQRRSKHSKKELDIKNQQMSRKMVIHTGMEGAKMLNNAIKRYPTHAYNKEILDAGIIDLPTFANLTKMIDSPDEENLVLAHEIIKAKSNQHGNTVHSGDAQI
jgi:hypothetical protein